MKTRSFLLYQGPSFHIAALQATAAPAFLASPSRALEGGAGRDHVVEQADPLSGEPPHLFLGEKELLLRLCGDRLQLL